MILNDIIFDTETKKSVPIDLDKIIKGRALFQANSGGGKSYLLRKFLEKSHNKVQQIIIDPEGEFATLREKFDYLLVGNDNADIPIDVDTSPLLARKLMETGASAILDLYELSPSKRIKFVKDFVDALINLPKNLWHPCIIVIDEIHIFAPESNSGKSESLEAVASLGSRGRKRGYALVGATQKLSKFNKEVAAELNTKFTGRCTLDIDQKRAAAEVGLKKYTEMRDLDFEFYLFGPGINGTLKVKSFPVTTKHEDIGAEVVIKTANPTKIKKMLVDFSELPQEAKNELKTKDDLIKKISELQNDNRKLTRDTTKQTDPHQIERAFEQGKKEGQRELYKTIQSQKKHFEFITSHTKILEKIFLTLSEEAAKQFKIILVPAPEPKLIDTKPTTEKLVFREPIFDKEDATIPEKPSPPAYGDITLGKCDMACLKAIKVRDGQSSKLQISIISGYSRKSGGFKNSLSKLRAGGYVDSTNGNFTLTEKGEGLMVGVEIIQRSPDEILNFWINKLGKCSGILLKIVCEHHPHWVTKSDLAERSDYSVTSGGFKNSMSELSSLGLVEKNADALKATEEMFPY